MSRSALPRVVLAGLISALAVVFVVSCGGTDGPSTSTRASDWVPEKGQALKEPEEMVSKGGVLDGKLELARGPVDISGAPVITNAYNGEYRGPTMRVRPGDRIELDLVNNIDQPTNLHFHGFHVSPKGNSDNVFIHLPPGETQHYSVQIPKDHATGTYWYHSHVHSISEQQVFGGMSGMIIMEGLTEQLPEELQGIEERQIGLTDTRVRGGELPTSDSELNPKYFGPRLVNGQLMPKMDIRPGEVQHWRLANMSATAWFRPHLEGSPFWIIAEDGNPVAEVTQVDDVLMPPGKRYDVLVRGPDKGTAALETLPFDEGFAKFSRKRLATVVSAGKRAPALDMPKEVAPFDDLSDESVAKRRTFTFSQPIEDGNIEFLINGEAWDEDVINVKPKLGTVEEWVLKDITSEPHPFHIHVNDFQVMSIDGKPYDAKGLQDVVPLSPNGGKVVIRQRYEDYTGKFVFHCHILDHEDAGMMQNVKVVG